MNLINFLRKSDGSFDSCHVYDIAHIAAGTDFDQAMASRGGDLKQIKCEDTSAPENARFQYDHSEGLDTIVNNVSCRICVHYIITKMSFSKYIHVCGGLQKCNCLIREITQFALCCNSI